MLALQSRYAITLYDLGCLVINRQNRVVKMAVAELRRKLGVPDGSFKNFAEFRRDVLAKSKSEIDQLANFSAAWEEVRGAGRGDRKSTRLKSSHYCVHRMPSSAVYKSTLNI